MRRAMLILATVAVLLVVVGGVAFAKADCRWDSATGWNCYCYQNVPCEGTNRPENIWGTTGSDTIYGYAGNDWIEGDNSGDRVDAGPGNDDIDGGYGNDLSLVGGDGDELIEGGPGNNDRCDGGNGRDLTSGCEFTVRTEGTY